MRKLGSRKDRNRNIATRAELRMSLRVEKVSPEEYVAIIEVSVWETADHKGNFACYVMIKVCRRMYRHLLISRNRATLNLSNEDSPCLNENLSSKFGNDWIASDRKYEIEFQTDGYLLWKYFKMVLSLNLIWFWSFI